MTVRSSFIGRYVKDPFISISIVHEIDIIIIDTIATTDIIDVIRKKLRMDWHWISWFEGTPFMFGEVRYNNGCVYKAYRFGPIFVRVYQRRSKIK